MLWLCRSCWCWFELTAITRPSRPLFSQQTCKTWQQCIQGQNPSAWARLCQVKWRWWKLPDGELTRDFSRGRTGSIDGLYTRQPLPSPTSGLISGSIGISSRGAGGSGGASSSASSSRAPSPGAFGFASFSSTPTRAGAATAASPKRMTLGRIGKVAFPVPMSYFGAKSEYLRRIQLDKDVAILFRMLQSPPFHAIAATYLSDVGMEGRDKLDRLANVDLTHQYYYNAVIREVNEANMVKHVSPTNLRNYVVVTFMSDARVHGCLWAQFKVMVEHDDNYEVEDGLIVVAKWANPCECHQYSCMTLLVILMCRVFACAVQSWMSTRFELSCGRSVALFATSWWKKALSCTLLPTTASCTVPAACCLR